MSKNAQTAGSKVPLRTCVACGNNEAKGQLVRFVRSKNGVVTCDASGRAAGRGAYLCASDDCFSLAEKKGSLNRALRCQISKEDYRSLEEAFRGICKEHAQTA